MTVSDPGPILRGGVSTSLSLDACLRNYLWASFLFLAHVSKTQQASVWLQQEPGVILRIAILLSLPSCPMCRWVT